MSQQFSDVFEPSLLSHPFSLFFLLLAFAVVPMLVLAVTSFIKLSVVFGILRNALGLGQIPSSGIVTLLSLILSAHIMLPVGTAVWESLEKNISDLGKSSTTSGKSVSKWSAKFSFLKKVYQEAKLPLEDFLKRHSHARERWFFASRGLGSREIDSAEFAIGRDQELSSEPEGETLFSLIPAFLLSELKEAFVIGFALFLPFLIVDLVVANLLVGLGMFMVSPVSLALPFKLILFVLCDGWFLLCRGLIVGYS